jgi:hypothetical protein
MRSSGYRFERSKHPSFTGALLSGQNRAAQQGKTKKLSFNALRIDGMAGTVKLAQF